jgi:hypothetical protein
VKQISSYFFVFCILCLRTSVSAQVVDSNSLDNPTLCSPTINVIQNDSSLLNFFKSLDSLKTHKKNKITILHIGDSHIQGDYMSRTVRYRMQEVFGERGRGLVFPYSFLNMYGPVDYKCTTNVNWENSRIFPKEKKFPVGPVGYTVGTDQPNLQALIDLKGAPKNTWGALTNFENYPDNLFDQVSVVYSNDPLDLPLMITSFTNHEDEGVYFQLPQNQEFDTCGFQIQTIKFPEAHKKLKIVVDTNRIYSEPVQIHGLIFENTQRDGILYHMAGVGACQLNNFLRSSYFVSQTIALKPDLIIFSLGANESVSSGWDTLSYINRYSQLLDDFKEKIPGVSFLITTPPDILYKSRLPVMKKQVQRALYQIAKNTNSPIWDLGEIMGGDYSNQIWHRAKLAGPDRIHFSPKGYDFQGLLLCEALLNSYNKFVSQPVNLEELEEDLTDYRSILSETTQNTSKSYPAKEQTSKSNEKANLPKPVKGKQKTHKVQKGESIYSISKKYGLDYNSVIQLNGFKKSTIIRPGQVIRLK